MDEPPEHWVQVMNHGYTRWAGPDGQCGWFMGGVEVLRDDGIQTQECLKGRFTLGLPADLTKLLTDLLTTYKSKPTRGLVEQEEEQVKEAQELSGKIQREGAQKHCTLLFLYIFPQEKQKEEKVVRDAEEAAYQRAERKAQDQKRGLAGLASGWTGTPEEFNQKALEMGFLDLEELRRHIADGGKLSKR